MGTATATALWEKAGRAVLTHPMLERHRCHVIGRRSEAGEQARGACSDCSPGREVPTVAKP